MKLHTDNGKQFIAVNATLKRLYDIVKILSNFFIGESIDWKFISPRTCVKSFKFHLKLIVIKQNLNYEEFLTITYSN